MFSKKKRIKKNFCFSKKKNFFFSAFPYQITNSSWSTSVRTTRHHQLCSFFFLYFDKRNCWRDFCCWPYMIQGGEMGLKATLQLPNLRIKLWRKNIWWSTSKFKIFKHIFVFAFDYPWDLYKLAQNFPCF